MRKLKGLKFLVSVSVLLASVISRAEFYGPELTHQDLIDASEHRNIIKDDRVLWPLDETARRNIELALHFMLFDRPRFLPNPYPGNYRYQVNPNSDLKIKEIVFNGIPVDLLDVYFRAPDHLKWGKKEEVEPVYLESLVHPRMKTWKVKAEKSLLSGGDLSNKVISIERKGSAKGDSAKLLPFPVRVDWEHSRIQSYVMGNQMKFFVLAKDPVDLASLPKPVPAAPVRIGSLDFEDCVESSLFRILMAFIQVNPEILAKSPEIAQFSKEHRIDWNKDPFEGESGHFFRAEWAHFLSQRTGFEYASGTHELKARWINIRQFFLTFFNDVPMTAQSEADNDVLARLCLYFGREFECGVLSTEVSKPYLREEIEVQNRYLKIRVAFKNESYVNWVIKEVFRKGDDSRVTGDMKLEDKRRKGIEADEIRRILM